MSMKYDFFFKKNRKNDKKYNIQVLLYRLSYIFPIFLVICEYHAHLLRTIHRAIFSHLRTKQSAAQHVCEVIDANKW